jgi:hypothetical protein
MTNRSTGNAVAESGLESDCTDVGHLLRAPVATEPGSVTHPAAARVGNLVGFADNGATPLVTYSGQPTTAAIRARATLDLHGAHVGKSVVLLFEADDPSRPVIVGCLREPAPQPFAVRPVDVEVDADGERLIVSAKERIVLRCGNASLTLTKEGKVIVQGTYLSHRSSGVLRLKGGSVEIN